MEMAESILLRPAKMAFTCITMKVLANKLTCLRMNFGLNTFLFTSPFTNESVSWFPQFKEWGFDSVEIALEDPANIDPKFIRQELDKNHLACTTICAAMGPGRDLRGSREDQDTAISYITSLLEVMPILGATMLVGPLYSSVGRAEQVSKEDYKEQW